MGLASHLSWWRLALVCLVSLTVIVVALIVVHDLWELAPDERVRSQVALFNAAMVAPVVVGVLVLYVALFTTMLLGSALLLSPGVGRPGDRGTTPTSSTTWRLPGSSPP